MNLELKCSVSEVKKSLTSKSSIVVWITKLIYFHRERTTQLFYYALLTKEKLIQQTSYNYKIIIYSLLTRLLMLLNNLNHI